MAEITQTFTGMLVAQNDGLHESVHVRSVDGRLDVTLRDEQSEIFKGTQLYKNATVSITITYDPDCAVVHPFGH